MIVKYDTTNKKIIELNQPPIINNNFIFTGNEKLLNQYDYYIVIETEPPEDDKIYISSLEFINGKVYQQWKEIEEISDINYQQLLDIVTGEGGN